MSGARPPENPIARQLHIKLGVVQRTQKELSAYHAELAANRAKVESMRARCADEFDVKKQVSRRWFWEEEGRAGGACCCVVPNASPPTPARPPTLRLLPFSL